MLMLSNIIIAPASRFELLSPPGYSVVAKMRFRGKLVGSDRTVETEDESSQASLEMLKTLRYSLNGQKSEIQFFTAKERAELVHAHIAEQKKNGREFEGSNPEHYHPLFPVGADWLNVVAIFGFHMNPDPTKYDGTKITKEPDTESNPAE